MCFQKKSPADDSRASSLKPLRCINAMTPDDVLFSSVVGALLDPEKGEETPFLVIPTLLLNSLPHSSLVSFDCPLFPVVADYWMGLDY